MVDRSMDKGNTKQTHVSKDAHRNKGIAGELAMENSFLKGGVYQDRCQKRITAKNV